MPICAAASFRQSEKATPTAFESWRQSRRVVDQRHCAPLNCANEFLCNFLHYISGLFATIHTHFFPFFMKHTFTLLALLATATLSTHAQQLFTNGPIVTGATSKSGMAAPTGTQWSEAQNDTGNTTVSNGTAGHGANQFSTPPSELADDFVVPAGQRWTVSSFSFMVYQTGAPAATSPIGELAIRVWNGRPGVAGSTVVFGSASTNRLGAATDALTYRIFNSQVPTAASVPGTTRKVWEVAATVAPALVLQPGTYWVSWSSAATNGNNHFYVPVTTPGARTQAGANAIQGSTTGTTTTWAPVVDNGSDANNPSPVNQSMAFKVFGTSTPLATRVGQPGPDGLSLHASPVPATDEVRITLDQLKGSAQLLLTDISGRLVWTGAVPAGQAAATVPVATLSAGIYLLEARTAAGSVRARVVKK